MSTAGHWRRLAQALPQPARAIQGLRPAICPFEPVLAAVPPGARVLELGCGCGLLLALLAEQGRLAQGIGIDAGAAAIARAERVRAALPAEAAARLTFLRLPAEAPWPDGRFDAVLLVDLLHHVPRRHQRTVVERAAAALAPGGVLVVKDMAPRPRWRRAMNQLHDLVMARQWIHHRAASEIAAWCGEAGLAVEPVQRFQRWWYAHELVLARRPAGAGPRA